jgi:TetR/AcrR family transcriptional repressor of nem operon
MFVGGQRDEDPTIERILEVGRHLMQSRGYSELRYADIAEAVGIQRASVHHYFPNKVQLGVAVIEGYRARLLTQLSGIDDEVTDAREKLRLYVELYRAVLDEDAEHMCPGGMLAAEVITLPVALRAEVMEFFADNEAWLIGALSSPGVRLRAEWSAVSAARHVIDLLQGALLMARLHGEPERLTEAAVELEAALWERASPTAHGNVGAGHVKQKG